MKRTITLTLFMITSAFVLAVCGREGPLPPPDKTPPAVRSTFPVDGMGSKGDAAFPLNGTIMITFTKEMDPATVNNSTITLDSPDGSVTGTVLYKDNAVSFAPLQPLAEKTIYTCRIDGAVQDIYGISMGSPYTFFFLTESLADTSPPAITATTPAPGDTNVAVNNTLSVTFNKPVNSGTLIVTLVSQASGTDVPGYVNYSGLTAIFTPLFSPPVVSLEGNAVYLATVKAGLQDLMGNELVSDYTWTFMTGAAFDTTPPAVTGTFPASGAESASVTTDLIVTFSEQVDLTTITVTLASTASGTIVYIPYVYDSYDYTTNTLVLKSSTSLAYNTLYTVRVSGVKDLATNAMPDYTWSFATAEAASAVSVVSSANPSVYGSPVSFQAEVSAGVSDLAETPTGNVTFRDNGNILPNGTVALSGKIAVYTTSTLLPGAAHSITATYNGDSVYAASTSAALAQTVNKAVVTVTAANKSRIYGAANPPLTASYTGFVNGDTSLVLSGLPILSTTAVASSPTGTYPITVAQGTLSAVNYTFNLVNGTFTVTGGASQTITFPTLPVKTFGNADFAPGATASSGLTVSYASSNTAVATIVGGTIHIVGGGTATITASQAGDGTYSAAAPVSQTLTVLAGSQIITFPALAAKTFGDPDFAPGATASSGLTVSYASSNTAVATIVGGTIHIVGGGTATITASQAGDATYGAATPVAQTLTVNKALATVTLGNLNQAYDGNPKSATATTAPANLSVAFTYNGVAAVPSAIGSYAVVATINDNNYQGTANGTLVIGQNTAAITLGNLSQTYDGTPKAATATTVPANLAVAFTYDGSATAPTNVGSYTVIATVNDPNYGGSTTGTLMIAKATAAVTLGSLSQTYDGTPKAATATTLPAGLTVTFTYNDSATAPTNGGNYAVVATVNDPNYGGSTAGTLMIAKATAVVTLYSLNQTYDGTPKPVTAVTSPAGLAVAFTYNGSATPPTLVNNYTVAATVHDDNYQGTASGTLTISPATTTTAVTSSANPAGPGNVTFTATITPAPGSGTVTFFDGLAALGTGNVVGGTAEYSTNALATGDHSITATFGGNADCLGSTSTVYQQTVQ